MSYEAPVVGTREPVSDWLTDYDLFDDGYVRDPFATWADLRARCPVATSERFGGSHLVLGYDAVTEAASHTDVLTSTLGTSSAPTLEDFTDPARPRSIINSDPPDHAAPRRMLLPSLSPAVVATYEPITRALCERLVDEMGDRREVDAAIEYAQRIPAWVIGRMLGVPDERTPQFIGWVRDILEHGALDPQLRKDAFDELLAYFAGEVADRRANPRDDLITRLATGTLDDGTPLPDRDVLGNLGLLLIAGIDTTWSSIGASLWHLAQHPEQVAQLRDRPGLWPTAVEELLRAYAPVTMGRIATADTTVAGCPVPHGRRVLLSFPAANRDPAVFENPDEVILEREHNRHVAFGSGVHRCAGSNLARMELRVALQTWVARIPHFRLADPDRVTWAGGQVRGPRSVPVIRG
jgi:hypothetical protein